MPLLVIGVLPATSDRTKPRYLSRPSGIIDSANTAHLIYFVISIGVIPYFF
jgi:hypothetical protein